MDTGVYRGWFKVRGTSGICQLKRAGMKVIKPRSIYGIRDWVLVDVEATAEAIEEFDKRQKTIIVQRSLRPPAPPCRRRLLRLRECGSSVPERRLRRRLVLIEEDA